MTIRKPKKFYFILLFAGVLAVAFQPASAQEEQKIPDGHTRYTRASLCGDYGVVGGYGGGVARALGTQKMDGRGRLTASAIVNQPGPNDTRTITPLVLSGTYTVNPDGTGSMALTIALPSGSTVDVTEDFVITRNKMIGGSLIATEIQDAQESPSIILDEPTLAFHTYTLRSVSKSCHNGQ